MNHLTRKKPLVAKVFAADLKDTPGSSHKNPVDLTNDSDTDEPISTTQSLPYLNSLEMESSVNIEIEETQSYRPAIISIEGIIGVGKSEVLRILSQKYKDSPDVVVMSEPSIAWENISVNDMNLLDLSYFDPCRYGYLFQMVYFMVVERQLHEALQTHKDKKVIICERSLLSARVVYTEMIPELDRIKYEIYQTLFSKEGVGDVYPNHIILLDTEPRNCVGRTSRKDWRGEEVFTLEYLQRCRRCHLEMKRRHSGDWTTIESHETEMERIVERVTRIVDNTRPIEGSQPGSQHTEIKVVSIEGNIGAGKSTLLNEIEQICKDKRIEGIRILREPVDEWERITDGTKTILELFYENPADYGFPLQILVGITTLRKLHRELIDYPDTKLILCERSILSSRMVFAKMLHHDGFMDDVEEEVYQMLFNDEMTTWLTPKMMLYLKTDPTTCLERIGNRRRRGENRITMSQLERCELYHKLMFRQIGIQIKTIDRESGINEVAKDWCGMVINWCQHLMLGKKSDFIESSTAKTMSDGNAREYLMFQFKITNESGDNGSKLLPVVSGLIERTGIGHNEIYLIKLKYDDLIYRIALPNHELTIDRFIWEIEQPWPTLKGQDILLNTYILPRDDEGKCEDNELNESLEHIEGIEGCKVNHILVIEINTSKVEAQGTTNDNTIEKDGETL